MINVEICCNSVESARNAKAAGAKRIELCDNLEVGGLTPPENAIEECVKELKLCTHVLVRPRAGDFCYSQSEYEQIKRQVEMCSRCGAHAVVVGFLHEDGTIDVERTREIVRIAAPMQVTFHRAFDECTEPLASLEKIIECGCHRILTSGCAASAETGIPMLHQLVEKAAGRIVILAGAGVTPQNAAEIITKTNVSEIHGSCKRTLPDGRLITDEETVRQLIDVVKDLK